MVVKARYPGWCNICHTRITPGEGIVKRNGRWVHETCPKGEEAIRETEDGKWICPECGEEWYSYMDLGAHIWRRHRNRCGPLEEEFE